MKAVKQKVLRVRTEYFMALAVFRKEVGGGWSCVKASPIIQWMRGKEPGEIKIDLLKMGARWEWEESQS